MTDTTDTKTELTADQQQMLQHLVTVDVKTQRKFAGIQAKIAMGILLLGIGSCFVFTENWLPGLSYGVLIGTVFLIMSRATNDYCDLTGLIQALASQQDTDS